MSTLNLFICLLGAVLFLLGVTAESKHMCCFVVTKLRPVFETHVGRRRRRRRMTGRNILLTS